LVKDKHSEWVFANTEFTVYSACDTIIIPHRLDGPAIVWNDGGKDWYYLGKKIDCSSQEEFERFLKLKAYW
jgi:hypothetical protein